MNKKLIFLSSLILMIPQAYIFAEESRPMWPPPNGGGQMLVDPREGKMMNQMTEPTGGSKMLPPFGNEWVMGGSRSQSQSWMMNNASGQTMRMMKKPPMHGSGMTMSGSQSGSGMWMKGKSMMNSGAIAERLARELAQRKLFVENLSSLGADVSGFTDEIVADSKAFWKLAENFKSYKEQMDALMKASMSGSTMKEGDKKNDMKSSEWEMSSEWGTGEETKSKKTTSTRPALTEKARKLFQDKLDKIAEDKRVTMLPRMLKNAESQLAKAEEKGNKATIRKLEAMIEMIEDEIASEDDDELMDSLLEE